MAGWSLRTKLVAAVVAALLPLVVFSGWSTYSGAIAARVARDDALSAALERAMEPYRELIEGSARFLAAACGVDVVRHTLGTTTTTAEVNACEGYLSDTRQRYPNDYTAMIVTDGAGIARCSTAPADVGISFADREIFRLVRSQEGISIGSVTAGRAAANAVLPIATRIVVDGQFRGMCSLDLSLQLPSRLSGFSAGNSASSLPVAIVDVAGAPVGGDAHASFSLPVAAHLVDAISRGRGRFDDVGKDGASYRFYVTPLARQVVFAVVAMPLTDDDPSTMATVAGFGLTVILAIGVLAITWFGADRWCVRPLRYIGDFAGKVARGEDIRFEPLKPWTRELMAVGDGVKKMAEAIANREGELKAGLEQRDHMLREIHHRVKNNLQMISSLLNLQAGEIRSPRIRRFFGDAQNRVLTLSILHRHLYERSSWSLVDFQQFISDLVRQISVPRPGIERPSVRYHIRAPIMAVGPDIAIPVGLIVTEAVGSALNHDFSSIAVPEIRIEAVEKGSGEVELVVEDNGLDSRNEAIGQGTRGSFGLTLIRGLAMQLGGEARISERERGGTRVMVSFPMPADGGQDA